jgi:osmotically-inducible protein OsmY
MRRLLSLLLIAGASSVVAALPVRAGAQVADGVLFERVAEAVLTYPQYGVFDSIDVNVQDRVVTLSGRVTNPRKKDDIEKRVQKVDGVRSVTSEIGVLPVPPIHIVVERGRITLTGLADSEAQRAMAASLAQVSGSFGVTNKIKIGKR